MNREDQNIFLTGLLQSLEDDFDPKERAHILETLKTIHPTDEALLGAKMLLEANHWDYTVLKKAFQKTEHRIKNSTVTPKRRSTNYLKYAAVAIPFVLFLGYTLYTNFSHQETIDTLYPKEEGLPHYMGTEKTNWDGLMEVYRDNKMKEAYVISQEIVKVKPENDTAIYFHGIISYELKNYSEAETNYAKMLQKKESVFYYDALYRLGFVLKKLKKDNEAQQQFEKIANDSNNPYKEKSKEVLELMK